MPAASSASSSTCSRVVCNHRSGHSSSACSTASNAAALLPVDLDVHAHLFTSAEAFYGAVPFRIVQLTWPDKNGWMPWESGFEQRLTLAQPVVGSLDEID